MSTLSKANFQLSLDATLYLMMKNIFYILVILFISCNSSAKNDVSEASLKDNSICDSINITQAKFELNGTWGLTNYFDTIIANKELAKYRSIRPTWFAILLQIENDSLKNFGSIENMKEAFINAGIGQFGSGWCWLTFNNDKLEIVKTPNAENPIVHGHIPLLGCDVWEHSYYVDYRNRRPDYLRAFVDNLVNWEKVSEEFSKNL